MDQFSSRRMRPRPMLVSVQAQLPVQTARRTSVPRQAREERSRRRALLRRLPSSATASRRLPSSPTGILCYRRTPLQPMQEASPAAALKSRSGAGGE